MLRFQLVRCLMIALLTGSMTATGNGADTADGNKSAKGKSDAGVAFAGEFWEYLTRVEYRNWGPAPQTSADFRDGENPHGARTKLYVNRTIYEDPTSPAYGSILILENFDSSKKLQAVTVMYRSKDTAPTENDWYWMQYDEDGKVDNFASDSGPVPLAGRIESCITCHAKAQGKDYIYANDPVNGNVAP